MANFLGDNGMIAIGVGAVIAAIGALYRELRKGDDAQSRVETMEGTVRDLRADLERVKNRLDEAYIEIHSLRSSNAVLEAQRLATEKQNVRLEEQNNQLREQNRELHEQNQELRDQKAELISELTCIRNGGDPTGVTT